jgi:hypothetical protein
MFWRRGRLELYDLRADPSEQEDLAARLPITVGYLRQRARTLEQTLEKQRAKIGAGTELELTPEERQRLHALGYVED